MQDLIEISPDDLEKCSKCEKLTDRRTDIQTDGHTNDRQNAIRNAHYQLSAQVS